MDVSQLLDQIRRDSTCEVTEPRGMPSMPNGLALPQDLGLFYKLCGGAVLFRGQDYSIRIVSPNDLVRANPVILGEACEDDRTHDWLIVGSSAEQYVTIDLHPKRLGRCYDSFWDRHGVPGECAIVATSFTELLEGLLRARGKYWFWLAHNFKPLGDAYWDQ